MTHLRQPTWVLWLVLVCLAASPVAGFSERLPDVLVFYREACPMCREMDGALQELQAMYPRLVVEHLEAGAPEAADLLWTLSRRYGVFPSTFPVIFVGEQAILGAGRAKELLLRNTVQDCMQRGCPSPLAQIEGTPFPWTRAIAIALVVAVIGVVLVVRLS